MRFCRKVHTKLLNCEPVELVFRGNYVGRDTGLVAVDEHSYRKKELFSMKKYFLSFLNLREGRFTELM